MIIQILLLFFALQCQFCFPEIHVSNNVVPQCKNGRCEYLVRIKTDGSNGTISSSLLIPAAVGTQLETTELILKGLLRIVQLEIKKRHNDSMQIKHNFNVIEKKLDDLETWVKSEIEDHKNKSDSELDALKSEVERLSAVVAGSVSHMTHNPPALHLPEGGEDYTDCASLYKAGYNTSGVFDLTLSVSGNDTQVKAYCDMETDGGGWTVIQRRESGTDDFFRNWESYKEGFGNVRHDFWLGLKYIHLLTKNGNNRMRIDLWDWENRTKFSEYDFVKVKDESDNYRIIAGGYRGNAGDPFNSKIYERRMQSMQFSTFDKDNDLNARASCARAYSSGWWFNNCFQVNLNGVWYPSGSYYGTVANGIVWDLWTDHKKGYSLKKTEIKFRPEHF